MLKTTLKSVALLSLVAGIYGLTGCTVDDESSSEDDDTKEVTISTDSNTSTITNSDRYDLIVSGSFNTLTLEDQINSINVSGERNTIIVTEDASISSITVTGDSNYIDDDVVFTVSKVVVTGSDNIIETGSYGTKTDSGSGNIVSQSTIPSE